MFKYVLNLNFSGGFAHPPEILSQPDAKGGFFKQNVAPASMMA